MGSMTSSPDGDHSSGMAPRHVRKENGENDVFKSRPRRTKKPARRSALDVFDQDLCLNECVDSGCGESCYDDESNYIADNLESLHPNLTAPAHCLEH